MVTLRSAVVSIYVECDEGGSILCGILRYHWVRSVTVALVRDGGVGDRTVVLGISWG